VLAGESRCRNQRFTFLIISFPNQIKALNINCNEMVFSVIAGDYISSQP
jgi:hypothetical protein